MPHRDEEQAKLPGTFKDFAQRFPTLAELHQQAGQAAMEPGPLDRKSCELVKIGICVGAGLESALRSHVRRAAQSGASREEIEQAIVQGMTTIGFPRTVAAWSWALVQFERDESDREESSS